MISKTNAHKLALWIAAHEPQFFAMLEERANVAAAMKPVSAPMASPVAQPSGAKVGGFAGFWSSLSSDLSSVGSDLSGAVSKVGSYIASPSGASTLSNLAGSYFNYRTATSGNSLQNQILGAQIANAQMGLSPQPVTYQTNALGQTVPVYAGTNSLGQPMSYGITSANVGSLYPSTMSSYLPWILGGGAALVLLMLLMR